MSLCALCDMVTAGSRVGKVRRSAGCLEVTTGPTERPLSKTSLSPDSGSPY